jgi:hypothetical protein
MNTTTTTTIISKVNFFFKREREPITNFAMHEIVQLYNLFKVV